MQIFPLKVQIKMKQSSSFRRILCAINPTRALNESRGGRDGPRWKGDAQIRWTVRGERWAAWRRETSDMQPRQTAWGERAPRPWVHRHLPRGGPTSWSCGRWAWASCGQRYLPAAALLAAGRAWQRPASSHAGLQRVTTGCWGSASKLGSALIRS